MRPVALALAGLLIAVPAAAAADPVVPTLVRDVKTGNYRLGTKNPAEPTANYVQPDTQIEPSMAVNPSNPDNAVAVYQEGRIDSGGDATNGFATTVDGGKTWTFGELPGLTTFPGQGGDFDRASDAVVAFGPNNLVYANSLVFDSETGNGLRSGMTVNVSKDGGVHWSAPVIFQDDQIGGTNDKNWIVVDNSDAPGHKKGRVYVVWDRIAPVVYDYCDHDCDVQANWLPNLQTISGLVFPGQGLGAYPVVHADGSLGMAITIIAGNVPTSVLNTDQPDPEELGEQGGQSYILAPNAGTVPYPAPLGFLPPVGVAANMSRGQPAQRGTDGIPSAAADPKTSTIYYVWDDGRFRNDNTNDVVMSISTDNGVTWGPVQRVNPGATGDHMDHYGASVAVGEDGRVHVGYRVRDESGTAPLFSPYIDSYYQESYDHGQTFTAPIKINVKSSHALYGAFSREGTFEGDYDEIATAGGSTYFVRCQGEAAYFGEPAPLVPEGQGLALADVNRGHQHQSCWVALIRDLPPALAATVPGVTPVGGNGKPPTVLNLRLVRRRFPGHRLRVSIRGATAKTVRTVTFYDGKRRIARDRKPPFVHFIRVRRRHGVLVLRAVVELRDGRKVQLVRRLARRAI